MDYELQNDLDKLKNTYHDEESVSTLRALEKSAKEACLLIDTKKHDGIKMLLEYYREEIVAINKELTTSEKLFENEEGAHLGRLLHARKKWCRNFLALFEKAERKVEISKKAVKEYLEKEA